MKNLKRIIEVLAIVIIAFASLGTNVNAAELSTTEPIRVAEGGIGDIISAGKSFIHKGSDNPVDGTSIDNFATQLAPIGSILAAVGVVIFLGVLAVMAIKWITAKPDQKAKLQQQFVGYVIAAIVFFGAVGIWNLVQNIMNRVETEVEKSADLNTTSIIIAKNKNI